MRLVSRFVASLIIVALVGTAADTVTSTGTEEQPFCSWDSACEWSLASRSACALKLCTAAGYSDGFFVSSNGDMCNDDVHSGSAWYYAWDQERYVFDDFEKEAAITAECHMDENATLEEAPTTTESSVPAPTEPPTPLQTGGGVAPTTTESSVPAPTEPPTPLQTGGGVAPTTTESSVPAPTEPPTPLQTGGGVLLFPFGEDAGDAFLPNVDDESVHVHLNTAIPVFGRCFRGVHVSTNGVISFCDGFTAYSARAFPLEEQIPLVTPFWDDIDITYSGSVSYRETSGREDVALAQSIVDQYDDVGGFRVESVFAATWFEVPEYSSSLPLNNTFQCLLMTDGRRTLAVFIYDRVVWPGNNDAAAGYDAGDGLNYFSLSESFTADMLDLPRRSNVDAPGVFVFDLAYPDDSVCSVASAEACGYAPAPSTPPTSTPPTTATTESLLGWYGGHSFDFSSTQPFCETADLTSAYESTIRAILSNYNLTGDATMTFCRVQSSPTEPPGGFADRRLQTSSVDTEYRVVVDGTFTSLTPELSQAVDDAAVSTCSGFEAEFESALYAAGDQSDIDLNSCPPPQPFLAAWETGPWSTCFYHYNTSCGRHQFREVNCIDAVSQVVLDDGTCLPPTPISSRMCSDACSEDDTSINEEVVLVIVAISILFCCCVITFGAHRCVKKFRNPPTKGTFTFTDTDGSKFTRSWHLESREGSKGGVVTQQAVCWSLRQKDISDHISVKVSGQDFHELDELAPPIFFMQGPQLQQQSQLDAGLRLGNEPHTVVMALSFPEGDVPSNLQWILTLGQQGSGAHHWVWAPKKNIQFGAWDGSQIQQLDGVSKEDTSETITAARTLTTVYDGSKYSLWVDGIKAAESTSVKFSINSPDVRIGQAPTGGLDKDFIGSIASVAIYDYALSDAMVQGGATPTTITTTKVLKERVGLERAIPRNSLELWHSVEAPENAITPYRPMQENQVGLYNDGDHAEYYSTTNGKWLPATVQVVSRVTDESSADILQYNAKVGMYAQPRHDVPLEFLRRPFRHGEPCSFYCDQKKGWMEGFVCVTSEVTSSAFLGYAVAHVEAPGARSIDLGSAKEDVIPETVCLRRGMPSSLVRKRYPEGSMVEVYQGPMEGWAAGAVLSDGLEGSSGDHARDSWRSSARWTLTRYTAEAKHRLRQAPTDKSTTKSKPKETSLVKVQDEGSSFVAVAVPPDAPRGSPPQIVEACLLRYQEDYLRKLSTEMEHRIRDLILDETAFFDAVTAEKELQQNHELDGSTMDAGCTPCTLWPHSETTTKISV